MYIPDVTSDIPYLTVDQMIEVDRSMLEDYKIELLQMMENAGRSLAHLARAWFFGGNLSGKKVTVMVEKVAVRWSVHDGYLPMGRG